MTSLRLTRLPVLAGLGCSVMLHLLVLIPMLVSMMTARRVPTLVQARFEPEHFRAPMEEPEEPILGVQESDASTMTWIGYEQYQEHLAALAESEQAAFTESPGAAPSQPSPAAEPAVEPSEPAEPTSGNQPAQEEAPQDPNTDLEEVGSNPQPEPAAVPDEPEGGEAVDGDPPLDQEAEQVAPPPAPSAPTETTGADDAPDQPEPTGAPAGIDSIRSMIEDAAEQLAQRPAPAQTPSEAPPAPASPPGDGVGNPADKESDASSTIDVPLDMLKLGKPLAAHGLELKPRRPNFTTLTLITASPGNPMVEIRFQRNGRPLLAKILSSSGDRRVDDTILSSLYRWRAKGDQLDRLGKDETFPIVIRIVLNNRVK